MLSKKKLVSVSLLIALVSIAAVSAALAANSIYPKTSNNINAYAQASQPPPTYYIRIQPNTSVEGATHYNPSRVAVPAGTTVTWINDDPVAGVKHTVTGLRPISFDSGPIPFGGKYQLTFDRSTGLIGKFPYHCTIHPWMMTGMISSNDTVVEGKSFRFGSGTGSTFNTTETNRNLLAFTPIGAQVNQEQPFLYNFTLTRDSDNKTLFSQNFQVLKSNLQVEIADFASGNSSQVPRTPIVYGPDVGTPYTGAYHVAGDFFTQTGDYTVTVELLKLGASSPPQPMKDSFPIHVVT